MKIRKCVCCLVLLACFASPVVFSQGKDKLMDRLIYHLDVDVPAIFEKLRQTWPDGCKRLDLATDGYVSSDGKCYYACMGFAVSVYDQLFEAFKEALNFGDARTVGLDSIRPGDIVVYRAAENCDHAVVVTDVVEDEIYYADCNGDLSGDCIVKWDNCITKKDLAEKLERDLFCEKSKGVICQNLIIGLVENYEEIDRKIAKEAKQS